MRAYNQISIKLSLKGLPLPIVYLRQLLNTLKRHNLQAVRLQKGPPLSGMN